MEFSPEVMKALGGPFPDAEVEFLPRGFYNGKARALAYIDARSVMRRLDAVVGPGNWSFDFDVLSPDGKMVRGRLTVLGVTKCDAGEGGTEDEVLKSAVSDALKRCAVHFGIGRYLYYLPSTWAAFDQQKKRFTEPVRVDPAAVAKALATCGVTPPQAAPAPARPATRPAAAAAPPPAAAAPGGVPGPDPGARAHHVQEHLPPRAAGKVTTAAELPPAVGCQGEGCTAVPNANQVKISTEKYGKPLCPQCQQKARRAQRAAAGKPNFTPADYPN